MADLVTPKGTTVRPGRIQATGGQGEILEVLFPGGVVFKRLFARVLTDDPSLERRLRTMVLSPPTGWRDATGHVALAWPSDLVFENKSKLVGFLMPAIDVASTVEIHRVANPSDRASNLAAGFTWKHLVHVARNLARAVEMIHKAGVVIGDFNERNILVHNDARITILDCDSMQVTDPTSGEIYYCPVGRPEFTPPELHAANWRNTKRAPSSDLFALAIHLHQLLLQGEHPYRGLWTGGGEKPSVPALARDGVWAFGPDTRLNPRNLKIPITVLPPPIVELFRRALVDGASNPRARPDASHWRLALTELATGLRQCSANPHHDYRSDASKCAWCELDKARAATGVRAPTSKVPPAPTIVPSPAVPRLPPRTTGRRHSGRKVAAVFALLAVLAVGARLILKSEDSAASDSGATSPTPTEPAPEPGNKSSAPPTTHRTPTAPIEVNETAGEEEEVEVFPPPVEATDNAVEELGPFGLWPLNKNKRQIKLGDTGDEVQYLQGVLVLKAGMQIDVDGRFGPATQQAVKNVQAFNDLDPDGVVGPNTWNKVDELALQP